MGLEIKKIKIKSANFNGESTLPSLAFLKNGQQVTKSRLDENDGLYVGYGFINGIFPYKMQDKYDRCDSEKEYLSITLENKYLKAVFLPELGGRLWSLYDKEKKCDLLYQNKMIRPCNLALRNAWVSGGIEYNCGMVGHSPFTCSKIFTATTKLDDGTPVLRFYAFERIRCAVYQMDFFLPEDSKFLFAKMRIVNTTYNVVPMYWWSNIAVPEGDGYRNIMNANSAYTTENVDGVRTVIKKDIPNVNSVDVSYPNRILNAIDYFWNIPNNNRKFTSYVNENGYGFVQTSTSRLLGRKLFVWGQGAGSKRWQEFLTLDNCKDEYVEIQAGLAKTQYECLPMPPKTAWEWVEAYGAIQIDKDKAHGEWNTAVNEVREKLEEAIGEEYLENLLKETENMTTAKAEKVVMYADGFGALENLRREKAGEPLLCPHLDFGNTDKEQEIWIDLLNNGTFSKNISNEIQSSWMLQDEWTDMMEKSNDCYNKFINLSTVYLARSRYDDAYATINKAIKYRKTPLALFILSQIYIKLDKQLLAGKTILNAYKLLNNDISLAREAFKMAILTGLAKEVVNLYEQALPIIKNDGRIKMYYSKAMLDLGNPERAYEILTENGGILVADIREGEVSITSLYVDIIYELEKKKGNILDKDDIEVPKQFNFRMKVVKSK